MQIDWWTISLQAVNILILLWILSRFLFRPVAAIIEERRAAAMKVLDDAEGARATALAERNKIAEELAHQSATREDALKAAAKAAETEKAAIIAAAREGADRLRSAAEAEIARERQRQRATVNDRASRLSVDIAAKIMARLPDEARVAGFIDGLAAGLAALPEAARAAIGDGAPIRLKAPRALSDTELRTCREAISKSLGRSVEIAVEVAPNLIAGLEVETPHAVVRNSLRADLDRIATELVQDEQAG